MSGRVFVHTVVGARSLSLSLPLLPNILFGFLRSLKSVHITSSLVGEHVIQWCSKCKLAISFEAFRN